MVAMLVIFMKDRNEKDINLIQSKCFECLVEQGLEKATARLFGLATGLSNSSLYYWFKDKDDIILKSTIYGANTIIDILFTEAYAHLNNIDELFDVFPKIVLKYKKQLRLVYQVLTSPQYGDKLREIQEALPIAYNSYAKVLADRLNCDYKDLKPLVQLFISSMTNYVLWEDDVKMRVQLSELHSLVKQLISAA